MKNVLNYPKSLKGRLADAVLLYEAGNYLHALDEFKKLVDEGCDDAFVYLGSIYESDQIGELRDVDKAFFYYNESASRVGAVHSYLGLVRIQLYGPDHLRDYGKALEYCRLVLRECENALAYFYIGDIYLNGKGVQQDLEAAGDSFRKAWEQGLVFGLAFLGVVEFKRGNYAKGWWYRIGSGVHAFLISLKNSDDWRLGVPFYPPS